MDILNEANRLSFAAHEWMRQKRPRSGFKRRRRHKAAKAAGAERRLALCSASPAA